MNSHWKNQFLEVDASDKDGELKRIDETVKRKAAVILLPRVCFFLRQMKIQ